MRLPAAIHRARQQVIEQLGADAPDLVVSVWTTPGSPQPDFRFDQAILPVGDTLESLLDVLDDRLEIAAQGGRPGEADLRSPRGAMERAFLFVWMPDISADLMVETHQLSTTRRQRVWLISPQGRLTAVQAGDIGDLFSEDHLVYRRALAAQLYGRDEHAARDMVRRVVQLNPRHAEARVRLATWERQDGQGQAAGNHLAMAAEMLPGHLMVRAELLRQAEAAPVVPWGDDLDGGISPEDRLLLAQALAVHEQSFLARAACRGLEATPFSDAAAMLLEQLGIRERGV